MVESRHVGRMDEGGRKPDWGSGWSCRNRIEGRIFFRLYAINAVNNVAKVSGIDLDGVERLSSREGSADGATRHRGFT